MTKINQLLQKKEKEELISIIECCVNKYPELKALIKLEKRDITIKIKKLFSNVLEWNQVRELIFQLDLILEGIKKNKKSWNKDLFNELEMSAKIVINNIENVHGEDEISIFLEEWFELMGEVFMKTNPSRSDKKEFITKIYNLINHDEYGNSDSFEKALKSICKTKMDLEQIKEILKPLELKSQRDKEHYERLYYELDKQVK